MFTWSERISLMVFAIVLILSSTASHCGTRGTLDAIRQVHSGVREAGRLLDEQIAPRFALQGDDCVQRAEAAGFPAGSGDDGMAYWRDCMEQWYELSAAVDGFRTALEELENVYDDIEAGDRGESDWNHWARRVLDHGRTVLRFVRELGVGINSETVTGLQEQLDGLCRLLQCDEEAAS